MSDNFDVTNMDAKHWTDEYLKIWPEGCKDYDTMFGWFANSIMCGYDNRRWKEESKVKQIEHKLTLVVEALQSMCSHSPLVGLECRNIAIQCLAKINADDGKDEK